MASPLAAFVVGNGVYAHAEGLAAAQDANTLTALLRDRAPGAPVACVTNADNAGLGAGFRSYLGSLSDGCVALVYFGGYGWRVEGKHYLLGVDTPLPTQANVAEVSRRCLSVEDVTSVISRVITHGTVVMLCDVCWGTPGEAQGAFVQQAPPPGFGFLHAFGASVCRSSREGQGAKGGRFSLALTRRLAQLAHTTDARRLLTAVCRDVRDVAGVECVVYAALPPRDVFLLPPPRDAQGEDAIATLQRRIEDLECVRAEARALAGTGRKKADKRSRAEALAHMHISPTDWKKVARPIQIFLKSLGGRTKVLDVLLTDTVEALRARVQEEEAVPPHQQRLIWASKQLEDGRTLSDYGITPEATVYLLLRLLSGPPPEPEAVQL